MNTKHGCFSGLVFSRGGLLLSPKSGNTHSHPRWWLTVPTICVFPQLYQASWFHVCVGTSLLLGSPVSVSQFLYHLLTDSFSDCRPDLVLFFLSVTTWTSLRVAVAFVITHLRASLEMSGPPLQHTSPKDRDHACWLTLCNHHLPRLCRRTFG